ncbi:MAG: putative protein-L-isoaspartate o-methyltransferase [Proteobacteria bacterium]|nr:putative protein-L-isoaspartate o-methyltransferase [Pseudomonadota bacterium]
MDIEQARYNMVEQQIRPWDVLDQDVLNLFPLGHGQAMWTPKLEARVIQELAIRPTDRVLEIGTGSGYLTALLAMNAADVVSVEIDPEFSAAAGNKLRAHGIENVALHVADAARDWPDDGSFDVIVLTGSTPLLSGAFRNRLRTGGRLFAIIGSAPVMQAQLITCTAPGAFRSVTLFETCVTELVNAPQPTAFVF